MGDDKYDDEDRVELGLEKDRPATIIVVCEPRNIERFIRNFGRGSTAAVMHPHVRLVWALLPVSHAFFGFAMSVGKLLAEALSFSRYWTVDDDLSAIHQYENPGKWFLSSFRRCLMFGQRTLEHATERCYKELDLAAFIACAQRGVAVAPPAELSQLLPELITLVSKAWSSHGKRLIRDPELLLQLTLGNVVGPSDCKVLRGLTERELVLAAVAGSIKEQGRVALDSIAGVSVSHARNKRAGYVHKSGDSNFRKSNQRYQFVLHNSAALVGHNLVPDETLLGSQPWHTCMSDITPLSVKTALEQYRHNFTNGCKSADHQFTRGLAALGMHGYQIYNFTHLRLEFPQGQGNAYITTDAESMAADSSEDEEEEEKS